MADQSASQCRSDFLMAATLPSVRGGAGIGLAMEATGLLTIISFGSAS